MNTPICSGLFDAINVAVNIVDRVSLAPVYLIVKAFNQILCVMVLHAVCAFNMIVLLY